MTALADAVPDAIAAYALFRRCYRQRTKPWEALAPWEQEGWREFFDAAARTIRAEAAAAERERIIRLASQLRAAIPADHPKGAQASFADYLRTADTPKEHNCRFEYCDAPTGKCEHPE